MDRLLKLAIPFVAASDVVPDSVPPDGLFWKLSATVRLSLPTMLPPESSYATCGCVGKATPPVELLGCVMNASCVASPKIVNALLVAPDKAPLVALRV